MKYLILLLKYFTLFFLFLALIYLTKYFGNYCVDAYINVFFIPAIVILIFINLIILYLIDFKRKKYKTTNKILAFLTFLFLLNLGIGFLPEFKTITKKVKVESSYAVPEIILYSNNTYKLLTGYPHGRCFNLGNYKIKNDTLIFDKKIIKKSQNLISEKYILYSNSKIIKSVDSKFKNLIIIE